MEGRLVKTTIVDVYHQSENSSEQNAQLQSIPSRLQDLDSIQ